MNYSNVSFAATIIVMFTFAGLGPASAAAVFSQANILKTIGGSPTANSGEPTGNVILVRRGGGRGFRGGRSFRGGHSFGRGRAFRGGRKFHRGRAFRSGRSFHRGRAFRSCYRYQYYSSPYCNYRYGY